MKIVRRLGLAYNDHRDQDALGGEHRPLHEKAMVVKLIFDGEPHVRDPSSEATATSWGGL